MSSESHSKHRSKSKSKTKTEFLTSRKLLGITGVVGALGILIGAFGAHALPQILFELSEIELQERREWLNTGVQYHMYHAAAMLAIALSGDRWRGVFHGTIVAWLIGVVLFAGSLYVMSLSGLRVLGAVVPIGGLSFIVGWTLLAFPKRARTERHAERHTL